MWCTLKQVGGVLKRKRKPTGVGSFRLVKMASASGAGSVASLWTEINRCGQNGDFTRALKAINKSKYL